MEDNGGIDKDVEGKEKEKERKAKREKKKKKKEREGNRNVGGDVGRKDEYGIDKICRGK